MTPTEPAAPDRGLRAKIFVIGLRALIVIRTVSATLVILLAGLGIIGYFVYSRSYVDPISPVDAIIVLGGENDGRIEYGFELARRGISKQVVLADPTAGLSKRIASFCETKDSHFTVTCFQPRPNTTRGEAIKTRELAAQRGWKSILIISWRWHLPRARYIFGHCFDGRILARPVPRQYEYSLADWEYTYLYQTASFLKATIQGSC